jgi:ribosomal-protein-alanine N-acetyltransferase
MRVSSVLAVSELPRLKALQDDIFPVKYSEGFYASLLEGGYVTLLVWEGDLLVAAAVAKCSDREAYLCTLGVAREHQGKGLGSTLLSDMISTLWERGASTIKLHVKADNHTAIRIYHKHQFIHKHTLQGHYFFDNKHHDAIEMEIQRPQTRSESFCTLV